MKNKIVKLEPLLNNLKLKYLIGTIIHYPLLQPVSNGNNKRLQQDIVNIFEDMTNSYQINYSQVNTGSR